MAKALFVTGTGTDVGKTYVAALMAKALKDAGLNAAYYKAAVSGNVRRPDGSLIPGDARFVREFAHLDQGEETMCPHRGAKPPRRCGLLGEISLLSPG